MKIMVIAAHPDDEVLGCGGAIAKHIKSGDQVKVVTLADGEGSRDGNTLENRNSSLDESCRALGVQENVAYNLRDNELDSYSLLEIVKIIEKEVSSFLPDIVYTHSSTDLNVDHQVCHKAVMTCCRGIEGKSVTKILAFEVPSSTEWQSSEIKSFVPNYFVDIENEFEQKIKALKCYDEEMRDFPHPRSYEYVECLSRVRGATVGLKKAEAFFLVRSIN
jgi:LmbE family N-acetylglucosaminyl deacetylase